MLYTALLHPEILQALASNGHGAQVLIADGNFPISTQTPANCKKVFLNLAPGLLTVTDVLKVLSQVIPVESYTIMTPPEGSTPPIHAEFAAILHPSLPVQILKRKEFYEQVSVTHTCLAIATGETRRFANILLTIGVIKKQETL